jgi:hypothetical protein
MTEKETIIIIRLRGTRSVNSIMLFTDTDINGTKSSYPAILWAKRAVSKPRSRNEGRD